MRNYFRKFVRNNYWFLVMNRKSPKLRKRLSSDEQEIPGPSSVSSVLRVKKRVSRKRVISKKPEETIFHEDSDDERECFINIRKKKLDLMRKNSPQEEHSSLNHSSSSHSPSRPTPCSSGDVDYSRSNSSHRVDPSVSYSDRNVQEDIEAIKKPRLKLRIKKLNR